MCYKKHLEINLIKEVQDLQNEDQKAFLKEIKRKSE